MDVLRERINLCMAPKEQSKTLSLFFVDLSMG